MFQDEGGVKEHLEGGAEVDLGFMFEDSDDVEGGMAAPEVYLFDGVGVAVFLEEWDMAFVEILDIFGADIVEDIEAHETVQELNEKFVVIEDNLEAVVFRFF
jgi:hypothetical protein